MYMYMYNNRGVCVCYYSKLGSGNPLPGGRNLLG